MFKVLAIGNTGHKELGVCLSYNWLKQKSRRCLQFKVPRADAMAAGLAPKMGVQFCFGEGTALGKFAISKGSEHSRRLRLPYHRAGGSTGEQWTHLLLLLPEMPPLVKAFPG